MTKSKVKKGEASECIVKAKALIEGINVYAEENSDTKIDLILNWERKFWKCQVKSLYNSKRDASKYVSVRNLGHNRTSHKVSYYTEKDIDIFIAVNLETFDVYLAPVSFISTYKSTIAEPTLEKKGFKNNFAILKDHENEN